MPITGIGGCCAAVATGQAAAPLSSVMNSRRLMSDMGTSSPMRYQPADGPARSAFRHLSLPQRGRLVLGVDLNRSESRRWPAAQRASSQTRIAHGERLYSFGDVRVATLALLIFTALSGWCSWGVVMTKFSGHVITFRSSPTVFADTPVPTSASTRKPAIGKVLHRIENLVLNVPETTHIVLKRGNFAVTRSTTLSASTRSSASYLFSLRNPISGESVRVYQESSISRRTASKAPSGTFHGLMRSAIARTKSSGVSSPVIDLSTMTHCLHRGGGETRGKHP